MAGSPFDVVCVGNLVADLIVRPVDALPPRSSLAMVEAIEVRAGGCALTTAVVLGHLGASVAMLGAVGEDDFGRLLEGSLLTAGVDCTGLLRHPTLPSTATIVVVDSGGERTYLHAAGAAREFRRRDMRDELLFGGKAVHIAGALINHDLDGEETVAIMREAQSCGILTSLDTAFDPSGRWSRLDPVLPYLDVFAPGYPEARLVAGLDEPAAIATWARARGVRIAIIKLGDSGAWVDGPGFQGLVPPIPVDAVDSTGAGESFNAGLLFGLTNGWTLERAARLGAATGALAVTGIGAVAGAAPLKRVLAFAGLCLADAPPS